jgi:hypothetical protein
MSKLPHSSDCEQGHNAAPYVLGALPDAEDYREHLGGCTACRADVAELALVVNALPASVPAVQAPESLRRRVMAAVRSEADLLHAATEPAVAVSRSPSRPRWGLRTRFAGALAAAAIVALAGVIVLERGPSAHERVTAAQVAASIPGAHAALRQISGHGELVLSGMPQPHPGRIYEVWLQRDGTTQATDALFGVNSRGSATVAVPAGLVGAKELLVTSEPDGGSSSPTGPPLIRVALSA